MHPLGLAGNPGHERPGIKKGWLVGMILKRNQIMAKRFAASGERNDCLWRVVPRRDEYSELNGVIVIHDGNFPMCLLPNIIENQKYAKQALVSSLSLYGKAAYYMDKKFCFTIQNRYP
jgi:hypothetical protein